LLFEEKTMSKRKEEHSFSIEMKSRDSVKTMSFSDKKENENVFFEGFLGKLNHVYLVEDIMLEIEGKNGILKLDITKNEMKKCLVPTKTSVEVKIK
jgi:hypothetical protein